MAYAVTNRGTPCLHRPILLDVFGNQESPGGPLTLLLLGDNLEHATSVRISGEHGAETHELTVVSPSELKAVKPAGACGIVSIVTPEGETPPLGKQPNGAPREEDTYPCEG